MDKDFFFKFNPDLQNLPWNRVELILRRKELLRNRIIDKNSFYQRYPNFDINFYRKSYMDLKDLSDNDLFRHYHFHGINEKRICNSIFFKKQYEKFIDLTVDKSLLKFSGMENKTNIEIYNEKPNLLLNKNLKKEILKFKDLDFDFYSNFYDTMGKSIKRIKKTNDTILNYETFLEKYPKFKPDLFYIFNNNKIDSFLKRKKLIKNNLSLSKAFYYFKKKNIKFVENIEDFYKNKSTDRNFFNLLQPELINISEAEFIDFFLNRQNNGYLFDNQDFFKKYPYFDIEVFKQFNEGIVDNLECLEKYHLSYLDSRLIGCLDDFSYIYRNHNFDLKKTPIEDLIHYHKKELGLLGKTLSEYYELYPNFDYNFYTDVYVDLRHLDEYNAISHWHQHGRNEGRRSYFDKKRKAEINKFNINFKNFYKYPYLFHKYLLNISTRNTPIKYEICKEIKSNNFGKCHIHCYDLKDFNEIYGECIQNLIDYFDVILTYSQGDFKIINNLSITILKIPNRGMDIGAKIITKKYLDDNKINFSNILFLHSKKDKKKREQYFSPFIKNKKQLNLIYSVLGLYDLIVPDLINDGDWNRGEGYTINKKYYEEILSVLDIKHLTNKNVEGNCLVASKKLIDIIFPEKYLELLYNILNTKSSFDYNWVNIYYSLKSDNIYEVYEKYKKNNWKPNHLVENSKPLVSDYKKIVNGENLLEEFLKDGSIEHIFERLWYNANEFIKGKVKVIKRDEIFEEYNLPYNLDTNLYKELNNKFESSSVFDIEKIKNNIRNLPNSIYSTKQILEKIPINFDIKKYYINNQLFGLNKYEVINYYIKNNKSPEKKLIDLQEKFNNTKTFVYVFPQYHEIPENNKFWGKGFTEWNNVVKTYSLNERHLTMHPHQDIGYYNILDNQTFKRWDIYADKNNFYGYVFCHYWFKNGVVMNRPLDKILESKILNKPWFLNWINENWTRRWDGGNNDILLEVNINIESCKKHVKTLLKYFNNKNYYKIDGKPCLGIYRCDEVSNEYINLLDKIVKEHGFPGIFFIKTLNMNWKIQNKLNSSEYWEGEMEYPPNYGGNKEEKKLEIYNKLTHSKYKTNPNVHYVNYQQYASNLIESYGNKNVFFKGIFPCWDNLPRHSRLTSTANVFLESNSLIFYLLLLKQFKQIKEKKTEYQLINSLNEWGEQCVLEPSIENEYSYLESFKMAKLTNLEKLNMDTIDSLLNFDCYTNLFHKLQLCGRNIDDKIEMKIIKKHNFTNRNLCIIHCFDIDKFNHYFGDYIDNLIKNFDIIVTFSNGSKIPIFKGVFIKVKNRGCNQGGYVASLDYIYKNKIKFNNILFLHSKTNDSRRTQYFEPLIGNNLKIRKNLDNLKTVGAIFPLIINKDLENKYKSNRYYFKEMLDFLNVSDKSEKKFAEGNCVYLTNKVVDFIFKGRTKIYYNIFNEVDDFDLGWVRNRYGKLSKTNKELYQDFINKESYFDLNRDGNHVGNNFKNKLNDMPDGMIEHIFERIYINVLDELNLKYIISN